MSKKRDKMTGPFSGPPQRPPHPVEAMLRGQQQGAIGAPVVEYRPPLMVMSTEKMGMVLGAKRMQVPLNDKLTFWLPAAAFFITVDDKGNGRSMVREGKNSQPMMRRIDVSLGERGAHFITSYKVGAPEEGEWGNVSLRMKFGGVRHAKQGLVRVAYQASFAPRSGIRLTPGQLYRRLDSAQASVIAVSGKLGDIEDLPMDGDDDLAAELSQLRQEFHEYREAAERRFAELEADTLGGRLELPANPATGEDIYDLLKSIPRIDRRKFES